MLETANGTGQASADTSRVGRFRRLLQARDGRSLEAATESAPELSDSAIDERLVDTGMELHRIVTEELGDQQDLHGLVDRIVAGGDTALKVLRDGDEERLAENPSLVRTLEVIVRTDGSRPSFMIRDGAVARSTSVIGSWGPALDDQAEVLDAAISCVGRIDDLGAEPSHRGTGFLVQDNLILTNRHVLQADAAPGDDDTWTIKPGATIDFGREHRGRDSVNPRALKRVVFVGSQPVDTRRIDHAKLDLALIELEPSDGAAKPTPLAVDIADDWAKPNVRTFIIGYPGEPPDQLYVPSLLEQLFRSTFGFKRLAPGAVMDSNASVAPWTVTHDCTTLGGNSGSVVLVVGGGPVAAGLHYGGYRNPDDDLSENWGHVLGKLLDTPGDGGDKTLREHFTERGVQMVDRLA